MSRLWAFGVALGTLGIAGGAAAQPAQPAQTAATDTVTLAPITCWSRTSASAVRVGEIFTLVLTCAVVETQSTTVVPDQTRLDPGALQVPPFEVVGGARAEDLWTRTHRYFQYEYQLRFVGDQIGADLAVPGPTISYRVQSRVQGDAAVESRDRQYLLPAARVRIVSLVPAAANDLQDPLPEGFRAIEDRRFRASLLRIVAWVLFGVGGVMGLWALAAVLRRPKAAAAAGPRLVPAPAVLGAVQRELAQVRRQRQAAGEWTEAAVSRALAALRTAGAYASGRPVAQVRAAAGAAPAPGQILVSTRVPRRRMLVSGSATAESVGQAMARAEGAGGPHADLQAALAAFAAAAYGRDGAGRDGDLDEALAQGERGVRQIARHFAWIARSSRAARHSVAGLRDRAWAR